MTYENFHKELITDWKWWELVNKNHKGKDIPKAIRDVHADYIGRQEYDPDMKDARRYVYNKLTYMQPISQRTETNYQAEPKAKDLHVNPLTDEQKKEVDRILNEFKSKLIDTKIPALDKKTIEEEGQERPKRVAPYPSLDKASFAKNLLHDQWIKECFHPTTGDPNENWLPENEWLELKAKET